jgi:6-phosphogluconolactonase
VHRIRAELAPAEAAREYEREIREHFRLEPGEMPVFDAMHRGIGPDAHTASLFPGEPLIADRTGLAAAVYVAKKQQWRITLLPGPVLAARSTFMLVTGADKAEALHAVLREPFDPMRFPAQLIPQEENSVAWFVDEAASRRVATA